MSSLVQRGLLLTCRTPLTQYQRFRGKINIQRPRQPHYDRALVAAVTQPIYAELPKSTNCFQSRTERLNGTQEHVENNPYNDIIAREVRNWFEKSRMVVIFHLNSISSDDVFRVRVNLHKQNMHLKAYGKKIIAKAVTNSRFEAILPLFDSNHCIVFSPEQRIATLLRQTRKVPQMIMLGGIIDNRLLSRNELINYSQLAGLVEAQSELVQTLNTAASNLVSNLDAHQRSFVNILDVYSKGDTQNETQPTDATVAVDDSRNKTDQ